MEKTYLQQIGERLIECRTHNFFSRKELSERSEVPVSVIKTMERGEEDVSIEAILKICKQLDCSIEYMLTGNCGVKELIKLNQKILNLPELRSENLQKIAQAFWNNCPKLFK